MIKLTLILALLWTSYSSQIKLTDYIDTTAPLTLTINTVDEKTGLTTMKQSEILPTSDKYKMFIDWCNKNDNGWSSSPASFNSKVSLTQNNFRFLLLTNGVAIGITDKEGKPKQFNKTSDIADLAFLTKE